jgi:hypothetical protein
VEAVKQGAAEGNRREQRRRGRGCRAVGPQRRPAVGTGTQVLAHRRHLIRPRLAVAEGGEQRSQLGAAAPVLAPRDKFAKPLPALGQAAIDFGLAEIVWPD